MPRPTKLTPEVRDRIIALLRAGNARRAAAEASGICEDTFYEWLKRGSERSRGEFSEFSEAVRRAESEAEALMVESVRKAARGYDKKTTRIKTKTYTEEVNGPDGKPKKRADGSAITATVTERETVEISGFMFHPSIAIEWLKRRRREDWGDKQEISGPDGGPIEIGVDRAIDKIYGSDSNSSSSTPDSH